MATVAILVIAVTVASCGADDAGDDRTDDETTASTERGDATTPDSAPTTTVDSRESTAEFAQAEGVLLVGCDRVQQSGRSYVVLDPESGEVQAELDRVLLEDSSALGDGPLGLAPANFCEEPRTLSPDRTKLALAGDDFDDGSTHVGWVELTTGEQTDLTAASVGGDFEAATPTDTDPSFGRDGRLYFQRDGTLMVADGSGAVTEADPAEACTQQATCGPLTHPSGRFFADADQPQDGLLLGSTDPSAGPDEDSAYGIEVPLTVEDAPWESVTPLYWIDETSLLCRSEEGEHRVVTVDPDGLPLDTTDDVELPAQEAGPLAIPSTERDITWTAPTTDGRALIFAASRGDEEPLLYRVDLGGTGEPEELGPVPVGLDGGSVIWVPDPD